MCEQNSSLAYQGFPYRYDNQNWRLLIVIVLLMISTAGISQVSKNVSLVGQLPYASGLNDIWGYADSMGHEYALVGLVDGVSIVDLIDPINPTELHSIPGVETVWRDLKTYSHYAYVCNEGDSGILVIDLLGLPDTISYRDTVIAGMITAHNIWIDEFGFLYMVGGNVFSGGIAIYDLKPDPWTPTFVGFYDTQYVHDVYVRDNIAYLAEIYEGQLSILDVSDKSDPQILGTHRYLNGFTHNTWLNDIGDVCFTTDEYSGASVIAWDITDPSNVQELDRIQSSLSAGEAAPHNVHVFNDYLMTSYYRDGLHITDAARPGNLVEVGYYDTSPLEGPGFSGDWGAYPFLPSGLVLATDREEGLFILQVDYRRACYLEGMVRDAEIGAALSGVSISLEDSLSLSMSRLNGSYAAGVADSGIYQARFEKYGYFPDTIEVMLDNGMVTTLDVDLVPTPRVAYQIQVLESGSLQPIEGAEIRAEVEDVDELFVFHTDLNGEVNQPRFVIDSYRMVVGKWGYITQEQIVQADSAQPMITFLLERGHYDDFALDFGWIVEGDARNGSWDRGEPIGTYETFFNWGIFNPEFDLPNDIGDQAYVTGNRGGSAFEFDVDRGFTRLVSPPIDLGLYQHPRLTFSYWLVNWSLRNQGEPGNDFLRVSLTDGIDTFVVRQYIGPFDTTWSAAEVRIEKYFPADREIQVLFYTQDLEAGNQDAVEAGIDGFQILDGYPLAIDEPERETIFRIHVLSHQNQGLIWYDIPESERSQETTLEILSVDGKQLLHQSLDPMQQRASFPFDYPAGIYIARMSNSHRIIDTNRFIKLD